MGRTQSCGCPWGPWKKGSRWHKEDTWFSTGSQMTAKLPQAGVVVRIGKKWSAEETILQAESRLRHKIQVVQEKVYLAIAFTETLNKISNKMIINDLLTYLLNFHQQFCTKYLDLKCSAHRSTNKNMLKAKMEEGWDAFQYRVWLMPIGLCLKMSVRFQWMTLVMKFKEVLSQSYGEAVCPGGTSEACISH